MVFFHKRGLVLLASIILLVFASIAVLSVTTFIVQRFSGNRVQQRSLQSVYLAQAGINQAIYYYRLRDASGNGYFSLGQTNVDPTSYFILGGTFADLLMVNTATAALTNSNTRLSNVKIQNATNSNTIVIDRMIVNWSGVASDRRLTRIDINGSTLWTGSLATPADANLSPNFTLNTSPSTYSVNSLRFNLSMAGVTYIDVQFVMTDGSSKTVRIYPASNNFRFIVKASGKKTGSSLYRTIQAEYNANTGKVVDYREINTQMQ
ncbi:MAG: hypothetical protein HZA28_07255 [Candidatus Omnitrophica bacterium]|nr:hypothetical protein [Candidatus Omnitrophota bacterium]